MNCTVECCEIKKFKHKITEYRFFLLSLGNNIYIYKVIIVTFFKDEILMLVKIAFYKDDLKSLKSGNEVDTKQVLAKRLIYLKDNIKDCS